MTITVTDPPGAVEPARTRTTSRAPLDDSVSAYTKELQQQNDQLGEERDRAVRLAAELRRRIRIALALLHDADPTDNWGVVALLLVGVRGALEGSLDRPGGAQ